MNTMRENPANNPIKKVTKIIIANDASNFQKKNVTNTGIAF